MPSRRIRDILKRRLHTAFRIGQRLGVDVLPRHFYSSIPDVRELASNDVWRRPTSLFGIAGTDTSVQLAELGEWLTDDVRAVFATTDVHAAAIERNGADGYGPMEAQILHGFIASRRPKRVVQVGAGVSTAVILAAAERHGIDVDITAVDPFPTDLLTELDASNDITLLREPAQTVDLDVFTSLGEGDLLFIDSTHTVKVGSEVNRLILEVLPRLAPGVVVHVHDITFPYDYQPDTDAGRLFFWDESTLLHAFLIHNSHASILVSSSMLVHEQNSGLDSLLVGYRPTTMRDGTFAGPREGRHFPSSTYLSIS